MADPVRVNGNMFSWGSIKVKIAGESYTGFTSIAYADKRERVMGYGMGRHHAPIGRTRGKYSTDPVKLAGRKGSVRALLAALAAGGATYGDTVFDIVVQCVEDGSSEVAVNDVLEECVVTGVSVSNEESADPLTEELEISCMRIRRDGKTLWDSREGTL
jgi:hypothetical protein